MLPKSQLRPCFIFWGYGCFSPHDTLVYVQPLLWWRGLFSSVFADFTSSVRFWGTKIYQPSNYVSRDLPESVLLNKTYCGWSWIAQAHNIVFCTHGLLKYVKCFAARCSRNFTSCCGHISLNHVTGSRACSKLNIHFGVLYFERSARQHKTV